MTAADGSRWIGSGTFIGPRTVLTAGHCVHVKGSGVAGRDGWMRSIQVMPGRNGASLPYGSTRGRLLPRITSASTTNTIGTTWRATDDVLDPGWRHAATPRRLTGGPARSSGSVPASTPK